MRRNGFIKRLAWGVYVRTTSNENVPSTEQISSAKIAAFHRTSAPSGIDEANQHGVAERGESEVVFEVDGASSSFLVFGAQGKPVCRIFLRRRVARKLQLDMSPARKLIKALWTLGPESCTPQIIQRAARNLDRSSRREFHLAHRWMPGWLSDMIHGFTTVRDRLAML